MENFFFGGKGLVAAPLDHAVSFFFVLSGFVLTYSTARLETSEKKKRFLLKRFARLAPTHYLTNFLVIMILGWWLSLRHYDFFPVSSALNFLMLKSLVPLREVNFLINVLSWAISAEIVFYFSFILLLSWVTSRPILVLSGAVGLTSLTIWVAGRFVAMEDSNLAHQLMWSLTYINPLARGLEFVFGMVVAVWWGHIKKVQLHYWLATLLEFGALVLVVSITTCFGRVFGLIHSWQFFSPAFLSWFRHAGAFPCVRGVNFRVSGWCTE